MSDLFDPARHEPLAAAPWSEAAAREAIVRIAESAEREFDEGEGGWLMHPQDEPERPGERAFALYHGAVGVVWALRHLLAEGAVEPGRDYRPWIELYPEKAREAVAGDPQGQAGLLLGESGALLLAWQATRQAAFAQRLHGLVLDNLHNPANEPLWGNAGTLLAAVAMAEAGAGEGWAGLVKQGVDALLEDMTPDAGSGHGGWSWLQDLYGRRSRHLGAGHGLAGNVFAALGGAPFADAATIDSIVQRARQTLADTALHGRSEDGTALVNWHPYSEPDLVAERLQRGRLPLVQDCHGAPGIVCRLSGVAGDASWDGLLRAAGELTWHAGPLAKGPSLCHGTAGSAMACLKLWRRFGEAHWLERARALAMHAAAQVEAARLKHGQGRHSLWTGDLGVACMLWECIAGSDRFPTLDHF